MPDTTKGSTNSEQQPSSDRQSEDKAALERLEKEADEMAGKAEGVENKYDQDHDIFTK